MIQRLKRVAPLSKEDINAVESLPTTVKALRSNQDITREGYEPSHACFVMEGWLCGSKIIEGGRRQIISLNIPGDAPDLQTLRLRIADYSLSALTDATVAMVPHDRLRALTAARPALAVAFWHQTLLEAAVFRQWMTGLGRRPAAERLAHLFCELYVRQRAIGLASPDGCPLPVTQHDLGDVTGITSVHVNRSLRDLRKLKIVELKSMRLTILNWSALVSYANFDPAYLHLDVRERK